MMTTLDIMARRAFEELFGHDRHKAFVRLALALACGFVTRVSLAQTDDVHPRQDVELQWGADLNFEAPLPLQNGEIAQNRILLHEADLHLRANLDESFESYFNFRAHDNTGAFLFELREGWVANRLGENDRHRLRIGKFALTVDEVNTERPWERAFISAPFAQQVFVAEDQEVDTGLEYQWRFHESDHSSMDLFAGITSGYCFGDCTPLNSGQRPNVPVYYLHPVGEMRWRDSSSRTGITYLGYSDADATKYQLFGIQERWEKGRVESGGYSQHKYILLTEWFFRSATPSGLMVQNQQGGYLLWEHALSGRLAAGLRLDVFNQPSLRDDQGGHRANLQKAVAPIVSYALSTKTRARVQYTFSQESAAGTTTRNSQKIELQFVAHLGDPDVH